MPSKDGSSRKPRALPSGGATPSSLVEHAAGLRGTLRSPRKAKRTSFPCAACGKTFPTQQAMAGHCSVHTRARLDGDQLLPAGLAVESAPDARRRKTVAGHRGRPGGVQVPSAAGPAPAAAAAAHYPSHLPFVHSMSNRVRMAAPPSGLDPQGPETAFWTAARHIQAGAAQLCWGTVFCSYTFLPLPCNAATVAVPSPRHACLASQPGRVRDDLTFQLGSGGGSHAQDRTLTPLLEDRQGGKRAAVVNGGDQLGSEGMDMDGLDLELRLCR